MLGERLRLRLGFGRGYESGGAAPLVLLRSLDTVLSNLSGARQVPSVVAARFAQLDKAAADNLRARSLLLRRGALQVLGLPPLAVGPTPDWHRDAASGLVAPRHHWSRIPYLDSALVGDHKSLWEVNRHQYLYAPAITWLMDGDAEDFHLIQRHLDSWLQENPPSMGVNWASSLEVAYRAMTWCWLLWLLQDAPWEESVVKRLGAALECSGLHIERYLSVYFSPNTHLTGEALGLFFLGTLLPACRHAERWRAAGGGILQEWLARQVHADGVYAEQATLYHRYTTEIYFQFQRLAQVSGFQYSPGLMRSLHGLFVALRSVATPTGHLPLIGDDDGGQLLPLDQRAPDDAAGLLLAGATALGRPELAFTGPRAPLTSFVWCGIDRTLATWEAAQRCQPAWTNRLFPQGGWAILRDGWSDSIAVAVIDAGPHGVLNCGHAHADALSMTLSLGRVPLFIDRGTLTYIGAKRNVFRSTASHNTMEFDHESSVSPRGQFHWGPVPERPTAAIAEFGPVAIFSGLAPGHAGTDRPSRHRRWVVHCKEGAWVVADSGRRVGLAVAQVRWQLAPGLVAMAEGAVLRIEDGSGRSLAYVAALGAKSLKQSLREVSLCYGHKTTATVIEIAAGEEASAVTLIVPLLPKGTIRAPRVSRQAGITLGEWADAGGRHQLYVPDSDLAPIVAPGAIRAETRALWLTAEDASDREDGTFMPSRLIALGARRLAVEGNENLVTSWSAGKASDVVASRQGMRWAILSGSQPSGID